LPSSGYPRGRPTFSRRPPRSSEPPADLHRSRRRVSRASAHDRLGSSGSHHRRDGAGARLEAGDRRRSRHRIGIGRRAL